MSLYELNSWDELGEKLRKIFIGTYNPTSRAMLKRIEIAGCHRFTTETKNTVPLDSQYILLRLQPPAGFDAAVDASFTSEVCVRVIACSRVVQKSS